MIHAPGTARLWTGSFSNFANTFGTDLFCALWVAKNESPMARIRGPFWADAVEAVMQKVIARTFKKYVM